MVARFRMEADERGTSLGEIGHQTVHRLHHQMHVDRRFDAVLAQGLADQRTNGEIRHVMVVHHIEVHPVRPGSEHGVHIGAKRSEVRGQDGRGDDGRLTGGHEGLGWESFRSGTCRSAGANSTARRCRCVGLSYARGTWPLRR